MPNKEIESLRAIIREAKDVAAQIANPQAYDVAQEAIALLETCVVHLENGPNGHTKEKR